MSGPTMLQAWTDLRAHHEEIRTGVDGVEHITARFYIGGSLQIRYRNETATFDVRSVHPDQAAHRCR